MVSTFNDTHIAQMLGYLNITGREVALLLNFKEAQMSLKRVVKTTGEKGLATDNADNAVGKALNP